MPILSVRDADHLSDCLWIVDRAKHEVRDVSPGNRQAASKVAAKGGSVSAKSRSVRESRRANDGPIRAALAEHILHSREVGVVPAEEGFRQRRQQMTHEETVAGIVPWRVRATR